MICQQIAAIVKVEAINEYLDQSRYDLGESVKTNVFSDQDEHVNVDVLEMFSDGMTAFMTVRYTISYAASLYS